MSRSLRGLIVILGLLLLWQGLVWGTGAPHYILPGPGKVALALLERWDDILTHALTTGTEIVLGLILGTLLGGGSAIAMASARPVRRWLMPVLVVSQAVPVFALAPILVLWLGYGMASKVAMAVLIIYFPVTAAFLDGLRRADPGWLDLARTMGATRRAVLWQIRLPAALPALGSGLRVATAVAPIGAVVGEWVGSSSGLGYLMLHANGRMQVDLMFAALLVLAVMAVILYFAVDAGVKRLTPWQTETHPDDD
ncbi:ABC transporter permease [Magnetospira sp. QH-2]|uniref:ABC transporter permease n=1 Tax=Magnetospira sp. (strain QH-2) TaxID=1288970 RepID=UPI0003E813AC|nr:ABC transporter permease [Magnetospira sp. QH-2]CCQ73935.1 ABC transporter permease protein. Substrate unknown [Magnetospira sp. QH-2]